ncbi:MAG: extracellular solute-binding protein [Anaerolineales bacterium]|nr:extracellular solute-binding protein [Anaerolineales bacterium]
MSLRNAAIVVLSLLLVSCAPIQEAYQRLRGNIPISTATPETRILTVYSAFPQDQVDVYRRYFEQSHPGIQLEIQTGTSWELTRQLIAQKENPPADVLWGVSAAAMVRLQAEGLLNPYEPATPEAALRLDQVILRMRDANTPPYWVGNNAILVAFCVNTDLLVQESLPMPTSWLDLLNPVYEGQLLFPNPSKSSAGYMAVSGLIQTMNSQPPRAAQLLEWGSAQDLEGELAAWSYLASLNQNIIIYTDSGSDPCQYVAQGEVPIGISYGEAAIPYLKEGFPLLAVFPVEGSGYDVNAVALIKKPSGSDLSAAMEFIDWTLSDSAMRLYASDYPVTAIPTDMQPPQGYISSPLKQLIPYDHVWAGANYERITGQWLNFYESRTETGGLNPLIETPVPATVTPTP